MSQKLAILSISLITVMAGATISPALGSISEAFPDANETSIKLINTLHALFIIPFTFISSRLTKRVSKKSVLTAGLILYVIGGLGGAVASTLWLLLVSRAVLGIAVGLIMPISTSLIPDFYEGKEKTVMMGRVSASNQLGGIISIVLAGILAGILWRLTFVVYGLALLVLVLVFLFLPKQKPEAASVSEDSASRGVEKSIFALAGGMFIVFLFFYSIPTNMAIFLQESNIASASLAGVMIASLNVGGFAAGSMLGSITDRLGRWTVPLQLAVTGFGFVLIAFGGQAVLITIGIILIGIGLGTIIPLIFDRVTKVSSAAQMSLAIAVVQSFMYFGQFTSPLVLDVVGRLAGGSIGTNQFIYTFSGITALVVAVMVFLFIAFGKRKAQEEE
ncbi:MFS transporter [Marinococcus luteus]|uniref:MFS transporter n=1 Tax=Marinococcus luteus TaxID=1122204 RepID=UPI002ACC62C2|nr:MFS transporter [Marinococcus luteus]MDZ5782590.1 MFS transporter [Marinococcus luteus]